MLTYVKNFVIGFIIILIAPFYVLCKWSWLALKSFYIKINSIIGEYGDIIIKTSGILFLFGGLLCVYSIYEWPVFCLFVSFIILILYL